jgi:hypothetical protein
MPKGVVKTKRDEADWEKAKEDAKDTKKKGKNKWPLVMHIFKNRQKSHKKKNKKKSCTEAGWYSRVVTSAKKKVSKRKGIPWSGKLDTQLLQTNMKDQPKNKPGARKWSPRGKS